MSIDPCKQFLASVELRNHVQMQALLKSGVDPNCLDAESGNRALTIAACLQDAVGIEILVKAGADVNAANDDGSTALTWAQSRPVAESLLRYGATVDAEKPDDGMLSLHIAASEGRREVLSLLLQCPSGRAAMERFDSLERTPLACAVESGHYEAATILLDAGADANSIDTANLGRPPIYWAVNAGDTRLVTLLLAHGADPTIKVGLNESPLELASSLKREDLLPILRRHSEQR